MERSERIAIIFEKYVNKDNFSGVGLVKIGDETVFHSPMACPIRGGKYPIK